MPVVNELIEHGFEVDSFGTPVGGLVNANFTKTLERLSGSTWTAASETVTVAELTGSTGSYLVSYTPTLATTYRLRVTHASYGTNPYRWEDFVVASYSTSGPYLTTRDNVKSYAGITGTQDDTKIDALLAGVTAMMESYCGRVWFEATITEYPSILGYPTRHLFLARSPVSSVASLHFSTAAPRVYGSSELLTEGTDYWVESTDKAAYVVLASPRYVCSPTAREFKIVYTAGFATIPAGVELAARRVVAAELGRSRMSTLPPGLTSLDRGDGQIGFSGSTDVNGYTVPLESLRTMDEWRVRSVA
jgi:hypothetical protein